MACGKTVAAGVKDQWLTIIVFVLLDFPQQDNVVAAVVLSNFSANEVGDDPGENRRAAAALDKLDSRKLVREWRGKLTRQMMLMGFQYVNREVSCISEIGKAGCVA